MNVDINPVLLLDLEQQARQRGLPANRLASEIVEAHVAGLRLKKLPPSGGTAHIRHGIEEAEDPLRVDDDRFGPLASECYNVGSGFRSSR
jgi:hypothetical protein